MKKIISVFIIIVILTSVMPVMSAPEDELVMSKIYADNMIFQRNKPIRINGIGVGGHVVTVTLNGVSVSTIPSTSLWEVTIPPQPAVKSTTLTITSGSSTVSYNNIAIGEVILCSGQSNMFYTISMLPPLVPEADKDYPDIRLFFQDGAQDNIRKTDIPSGNWRTATIDNAKAFSAVGFLTGKKFYKDTNGEIPVGLILAAIGGTSINIWTTTQDYDIDPDLTAMKAGIGAGQAYNNMLAPFENFTLGSFMWYQGEANVSLTQNYEKMLITFIDCIRKNFKDPELPFIIIQLPRHDYFSNQSGVNMSVAVRDSQYRVSQKLKNVALVVTIDTGEDNLHSVNKLPVAHRAMLALKHFINPQDTDLVWQAPEIDTSTTSNGITTLTFKNIGTGLSTSDGVAPKEFMVSGSDMVFQQRTASLVSNTVQIDTSGLIEPVYVRHAWAEIPFANIINSAGIPLSQFSTAPEQIYYKTRTKTSKPLEDPLSDPLYFSPMIRAITPGKNGILTGSAMTFEIEAFSFGNTSVSTVEALVDGVSVGNATRVPGTNKYSITVPSGTQGIHYVQAVVTDSIGTTNLLQHPSKGTQSRKAAVYSFVYGNYVEQTVNTTDITFNKYTATDGATLPPDFQSGNPAGNTLVLSGGSPQVYGGTSPRSKSNSLKITSAAVGEKALLNMPNAFGTAYDKWRYVLSADLYFDGEDGTFDAERIFRIKAGAGAGTEYQALSFQRTATNNNNINFNLCSGLSLQTFKFENKKWYNIRMEIDPKSGTASVWSNGVCYYQNQPLTAESMKTNMRLGIKSASFEHTGKILAADDATRDIQEAVTYVDNLQCGYVNYAVTPTGIAQYTLSEITKGQDGYRCGFMITNNSGYPVNGMMLITGYADSGAMVSTKIIKTKTAVLSGASFTLAETLPANESITQVKAFAIKDLANMMPLCAAVSYTTPSIQ